MPSSGDFIEVGLHNNPTLCWAFAAKLKKNILVSQVVCESTEPW